MKKYFIKFNEALALKELGFNEPCLGYYDNMRSFGTNYVSSFNQEDGTTLTLKRNKNLPTLHGYNICTAPLYHQAFDFLKKEFQLQYKFEPTNDVNVEIFTWNIVGWKYFKTCNEDIANFECLKELIKIAKQ